MTTTTVAQMVTALLGDWTPTDHPELYKDAFNYVADLIPKDSDLWANSALLNDTSVTNSSSANYKIIKVTRDADSTVRECEEVPYKDYLKGTNATSIFYHGKSSNNPIWTWGPDGQTVVSPTDGTIKFYYWKYTDSTDFHTSDAISVGDSNTLPGFPKEAHLLAVIKVAINIMYTKISDAVQDEEDAELLQLLQAQMQALQQWFMDEGRRLKLPHKLIGVDNDPQ
jgi:hypothetical protein